MLERGSEEKTMEQNSQRWEETLWRADVITLPVEGKAWLDPDQKASWHREEEYENEVLGQIIQAMKLGLILFQVKWEDIGEF